MRAMLLLKEMLREGWIKPEMDYNRFKAQLGACPPTSCRRNKRFNPLALNPYVLYKALRRRKNTVRRIGSGHGFAVRCNSAGVERTRRSAGIAANFGAIVAPASSCGLNGKKIVLRNVTSSAKTISMVGKDFACLKIAGRANFFV